MTFENHYLFSAVHGIMSEPQSDIRNDQQGQDQCEKGQGQLVAKHYNELQESGRDVRTESRIYYMRNFNNWIKSVVIGKISF